MTFLELATEIDSLTETVKTAADRVAIAKEELHAAEHGHKVLAAELQALYDQMQEKMGTPRKEPSSMKQLILDSQQQLRDIRGK